MDSLLLQDFVTISTTTLNLQGFVAVTQGASSWLDVSAYEDLVIFFDVRNVTSNGMNGTGLPIAIQTAPAAEDASFVPMTQFFGQPFLAVPLGVSSFPLLAAYSPVPAAQYLRWQIVVANEMIASLSATFRIWVSAYSLDC